MVRKTAVAVLSVCLLLPACGGKEVELRAAAPSASPSAAASTPSPVVRSPPTRPVGSPLATAQSFSSPTAASKPPPPAPKPPAAAPQPDYGALLWNTTWRAVERTRSGEPWPFIERGEWTVGFESAARGVMRWGACNHTGAKVVVTADRLLVDDGPRESTAIGCDAERTAEDNQAADFFLADPTWRRTGDTLLLTSGEIVVRLRLADR